MQDAPEAEPAVSEAGLGEIVVTATRRATNLQDTPVAVSAIDQGLIEQASPRDIGDLAAFVPNFSAATVTNRSEEHTSELQSLMRISYAVFCLNKTNTNDTQQHTTST